MKKESVKLKMRAQLLQLLRRHNHEPADVWYEPNFAWVPHRGWYATMAGVEYHLGTDFEDAVQKIEIGNLTRAEQ